MNESSPARRANPRTHANTPVTPMLARKPIVRNRIIPRSNSIPWMSPRPLCWNTRFSTSRVAANSWDAKKNRIRVPTRLDTPRASMTARRATSISAW